MLNVRKLWPDPEYFYALPTQGHGRRVAWEPIKKLIPDEWISSINESSMVIKTKFGSTLRILGLDRPHRAEGLQYDGGVIDESSDQRPKVFDLTFRPALTHRKGWCWRIGVPKRFGVGAREFREFFEMCTEKRGDGLHAAYSWPSSDILDPAEMLAAAGAMDAKDYHEQFDAVWESSSGLVYHAFDTGSLCDYEYNPTLPIAVGSDFNVDPMAWVLAQVTKTERFVFDEIWENNTNTQRTLDLLFERYKDHKAGWYFFGDASGRARRSSAFSSDYSQIKNDVRFKPSKVLYPRSNPAVHDRVASVNAAFKSATGVRKLYISRKCLHLIRDLEYLSYDEGTRDICTADSNSKHITDALGYFVHFLDPLRTDVDTSNLRVGVGT